MNYDVFNGDADGIIALLQLRLAQPRVSTLITGVKRDIALLRKISPSAGDKVTVLDISMAKNSDDLIRILDANTSVFYADHHQSGDLPTHPSLEAHIDPDADTCTALIIDQLLAGKYHYWAIAAAYGDNLIAKADLLANKAGLSNHQRAQLQELGTLVNYNGYGESLQDLHYPPAVLYQQLLRYPSPFDVITDLDSPFYCLQAAYQADMTMAMAVSPRHQGQNLSLFELPDCAASRRISGVYGNWLANRHPSAAHAVLTRNQGEGTEADEVSYTVSLRAPLQNKQGAGAICSQFNSGGGREAAAGINRLPRERVTELIQTVEEYYSVNQK